MSTVAFMVGGEDTKRRQYTPEQIVPKLREADQGANQFGLLSF